MLTFLLLNAAFFAYSQSHFYGTWYILDGDDISRNRIAISTNGIVAERYEDYEVEEPYWEVENESNIKESRVTEGAYQVVGFSEESNAYFGGEFWLTEQKGELMAFQMRQPHPSVEKAYQSLDDNKYKEMMANTFYSEDRMKEIMQMPDLGSLTKEDLLTTIKYVQSHTELLNSFINEHADQRVRFLVSRAAENLKNRKFIELGYNPFKYTEPYFMDKFKDDPDLEKLNEQSVHFKF